MSGQTFYMHCHPYGNPIPEIYWFKDDIPLRLFDGTMISTDYGEIIQTPSAKYEHSGNYTCIAKNKVGKTGLVYLVDVLGEYLYYNKTVGVSGVCIFVTK